MYHIFAPGPRNARMFRSLPVLSQTQRLGRNSDRCDGEDRTATGRRSSPAASGLNLIQIIPAVGARRAVNDGLWDCHQSGRREFCGCLIYSRGSGGNLGRQRPLCRQECLVRRERPVRGRADLLPLPLADEGLVRVRGDVRADGHRQVIHNNEPADVVSPVVALAQAEAVPQIVAPV